MKKFLVSLVLFVPSVALAAPMDKVTNANELAQKIVDLSNLAIELLIGLAVLYVVWNVIRFISADGDARTEYRASILWGVVGLAIILSIWGLVWILANTFGLGGTVDTPTQQEIQGLVPIYDGTTAGK